MKIPCSIDGQPYVVEWRGARIQTVDATRELVDQGPEPGEQTLAPNAAWRRTGEDFVLGAGQTWFDLNEESTRRRFRHGQGIDPWDRRAVKLQKSALGSSTDDSRLANTSWAAAAAMCVANAKLFVSVGPDMKEITDPTAASWAQTTRLTFGFVNPITSVASDGVRLWACTGLNRIQEWNASTNTANTTFSASANWAYLLVYAAGRLLAAGDSTTAAVLYELSASGKRTDVWTHPSSLWRWTAATAAPNGIYIAGEQGDGSDIYLVTNTDATGALAAPFVVASLPQGENVTALCHYGGVMVIGTSRGIRLANIGGNGFLNYGPLLEMPDPVITLEPQGEYVWFNYADPNDVNNQGLARLSLARFTSPLVPAWCPDLVGTSAGGWQTTTVTTCNGRRYFGMVKTGVGNGTRYFGEDADDYVPSGVLHTGRITYGIPDPKVYSAFSIGMEPLAAGQTIGASITTEEGASVPLPSTAGTKRHRWTTDITDEWVDVAITLTRGATTDATPILHRWTMEALPVAQRTHEVWLPVILHGKVEHERRPMAMDTFVAFERLMALVRSRRPVTLKLGNWTQRVFVDGLYVGEGDGFVGVKDWNDAQTWIDATWMVKLVTLDP